MLEGLVAVGDAARHEDGGVGAEFDGDGLAEAGALPQVDPGAEHPAGGDGDELVPRLGVEAAGDAGLGVVRHAVLHRTEVGQPEGGHLGPLPVLLEPAALVAVQRQVDDQQAGDRGGVDASRGSTLLTCEPAHWPAAAYLASVACFTGRHQSSLARYQSIVAARPDSKSR